MSPEAKSEAVKDGGLRLAVDIGGTFTDVALERGTERVTVKVLTTPTEPSAGVLDGVSKVMELAGAAPGDVSLIIHGTTLATNALIERRGAKTALIGTEGHRDAVEMAYENRFEQYDINIDRPQPLVPRYLRFSIRERMNKDGDILIDLDEDAVRELLPQLDDLGVESVAIGLLHAYVNPAHEQRIAEILKAERPHISLTLASSVCPEVREYERLSTACANAYVRPLMERYLQALSDQLVDKGFICPFFLMTSGGGLTTLDTAMQFPIRLVESGPAGGAILATTLAHECDVDRALSFDMGGTTAKICLIDDYKPLASRTFEVDRIYRFKKGSGLPVRIPVIEMVEIGAGGGSIASIDTLGRIQVGPESAGSEPGPVAYGRGGTRPTVTDADAHLGRIIPDTFAGGAIALQIDHAQAALAETIGAPAGFDADLAGFAVSDVVDENMAAAARAHAVEWGKDVSARAMIAFGGAAPLHATRLAEKLGINQIIIPTGAGVGSALGFLLAPVAYEVVRSRHMRLDDFDADSVNALMTELQSEAMHVVRRGAPDAPLTETRQAYMRYVGQGHEIAVDLPLEPLSAQSIEQVRQAFEETYSRLFSHVIPGLDVEILSWTLSISTSVEGDLRRDTAVEAVSPPKPHGYQSFFDPAMEKRLDVPIYLRKDLAPGMQIDGPALITEEQTTTVVTSLFRACINSLNYIVLDRKELYGS